jgi:hypothetical protein
MNSLTGQLFLVLIAVVSASGGIYATVVSRNKIRAEVVKVQADTAHVSDKTWIERLDALSRDLGRLQTLSDQRFAYLMELERLITAHVTWDFKVVRLLREHGIEVDEPPSLVYVKQKLTEVKSAMKRDMGSDPNLT